MATDPQVKIRQKFDEITAEAAKEADEENDRLTASDEAQKLTPEQQVRKYHNELITLKLQTDDLKAIEYFCFANNKMLLYKLFSSRILCNERNEGQYLRKGILMAKRYKKLSSLLSNAKKKVAPFTYLHFMANKYNVILYELHEQPCHTTDEDYLKIRTWQVDKIVDCTCQEFNILKENFILFTEGQADIEHPVKREAAQLENIYLNHHHWDAAQFKAELALLNGFKNVGLAEDFIGFYALFNHAMKRDMNHFLLNPRFFYDAIRSIENRELSNALIFCLSFFMYWRWLMELQEGTGEWSNNGETTLDALFNKGVKEGRILGQITVRKLKNDLLKRNLKQEQYHQELMKEYSKQLQLINELIYPYYFAYLEQKPKLRNCFVVDCLYSLHTEIPLGELKKTIALDEVITSLEEDISILEHNPLGPFSPPEMDKTQLFETICHLAPQTTLIKSLLKILARIHEHCLNENLPLSYVCNEINQMFSTIFKPATEEYLRSIWLMNTDKRGYFILGQLRDIKYLMRMYKIDHHKLPRYLKHVKHINEDELETIQQLMPFKVPDINEILSKEEPLDNKAFSFGYHPGPKPFKPIVKAMFLKMNLGAGDSTVEDFMEIITCPDLTRCTKKFQLGLKTNVFVRFIEKAKPWFKHLTAARIERSGVFISLKEGPMTASVIYNSKTILAEDSDLLDEIFNAKYSNDE